MSEDMKKSVEKTIAEKEGKTLEIHMPALQKRLVQRRMHVKTRRKKNGRSCLCQLKCIERFGVKKTKFSDQERSHNVPVTIGGPTTDVRVKFRKECLLLRPETAENLRIRNG